MKNFQNALKHLNYHIYNFYACAKKVVLRLWFTKCELWFKTSFNAEISKTNVLFKRNIGSIPSKVKQNIFFLSLMHMVILKKWQRKAIETSKIRQTETATKRKPSLSKGKNKFESIPKRESQRLYYITWKGVEKSTCRFLNLILGWKGKLGKSQQGNHSIFFVITSVNETLRCFHRSMLPRD